MQLVKNVGSKTPLCGPEAGSVVMGKFLFASFFSSKKWTIIVVFFSAVAERIT